MESPPKLPRLPVDVLLEIVARSDVTTAVRCAATSTLLRKPILSPGFRHRLQLRAAASGGGARCRGFDPARLLGVSYSSRDLGGDGVVHLGPPPARRVSFDTGLLRSSHAVSSRDGLLVLSRCDDQLRDLRVCNTFTGGVTRLPPMDVLNDDLDCYRPALLSVVGGSFEVLVMDARLRLQIFSSKDGGAGECGAVRAAAPPPGHVRLKPYVLQTSPSVIGRTVHYLCHSTSEPALGPSDGMLVLAVDADAAAAAAIELPEGCVSAAAAESCNLAVTADGRLSVLVAEAEAILVWALEEEGSWTRRAVIDRRRIDELEAPLGPGGGGAGGGGGEAGVQGFGERSGAALLRVDMVGLVLLGVETGKAVLLRGGGERDTRTYKYERAWLHEGDEIDLAALLEGMKEIGDSHAQYDSDDDDDEYGSDDDEYHSDVGVKDIGEGHGRYDYDDDDEDDDSDDEEEDEDSDEEEEDDDSDEDEEEEDDNVLLMGLLLQHK